MEVKPFRGVSNQMRPPSPFISFDDINGYGEIEVTIEDVVEVTAAPSEEGPFGAFALRFVDKKRMLVINVTKNNALTNMFGPQVQNWIGQKIKIVADPTIKYRKKRGGVRIVVNPALMMSMSGAQLPAQPTQPPTQALTHPPVQQPQSPVQPPAQPAQSPAQVMAQPPVQPTFPAAQGLAVAQPAQAPPVQLPAQQPAQPAQPAQQAQPSEQLTAPVPSTGGLQSTPLPAGEFDPFA